MTELPPTTPAGYVELRRNFKNRKTAYALLGMVTSKSLSTTAKRTMARRLPPIHPGEILKETLDDLGISMNRLAQALHVPANRVSGIVAGQRAITGETALRLARYFDTTPDYWINMQAQYELETARDEWDAKIQSQVRPRHAA
jgi:antitoxin HigA-1